MTCSNCNKMFDEGDKFCSECGQNADSKLTVGFLFKDTLGNYFSLDAKIYKSFIPLIFKPGLLAETFVEGKRLTYLHPAKFYLFTSVLLFLVISLNFGLKDFNHVAEVKSKEGIDLGFNFNDPVDTIKKESILLDTISRDTIIDQNGLKPVETDSLVKETKIDKDATYEEKIKALGWKPSQSDFMKYVYLQILKLKEEPVEKTLRAAVGRVPFALFLFLPFFAFLLVLFYRRSKRPFVDHLVFTFYFFTFVFLIFVITSILALGGLLSESLFFLSFIVIWIYFVFSVKRFYKRRLIRTIIKSVFFFFVFLLTLIPFTLILLLITFITY